MLSPYDIQFTKMDLMLFSTILIITHITLNQFTNVKLFDYAWVKFLLATWFGVSLHGLITNKITSITNNTLNLRSKMSTKSVSDIVRFGTIFVCQKILVSYMNGDSIIFDFPWVSESTFIIIGRILFNIIEPYFIFLQSPIINDITKSTMSLILSTLVIDENSIYTQLFNIIGNMIGFVVYHNFTKKIITL